MNHMLLKRNTCSKGLMKRNHMFLKLKAADNLQEFPTPPKCIFSNQKNKKEKNGFFDLFLKQQATCRRPLLLVLSARFPLLQGRVTASFASALRKASAYVSIHQHTSAYVSIRQHTSAYVSIRQ